MAWEWWADGTLTLAPGFRAGAAACGLKPSGAPDVALVVGDDRCAAAGVFTRNRVVAAPVIVDRETLATSAGWSRAVAANSGNANACTGRYGLDAARTVQSCAADAIGCEQDDVLVLSTGVIGVPLDAKRACAGIRDAARSLDVDGGRAAARAIMTTDTRPKTMGLRADICGRTVTVAGIAKGSGMIHPDMGTMLAVLTTDAEVEPGVLQALLDDCTRRTFNRISVDGDTSTNDTVLALAGGGSGLSVAEDDPTTVGPFRAALAFVCQRLALEIVGDGEGATRLVTVTVRGAGTEGDALAIARTVATSPLVKTAWAGGDPNWGRIVAAAGRAGVEIDPERMALWVVPSERPPARGSAPSPPPVWDDAPSSRAPEADADRGAVMLLARGEATGNAEAAAEVLACDAFQVVLELGMGAESATVWTTDLTAEYVRINADYTT